MVSVDYGTILEKGVFDRTLGDPMQRAWEPWEGTAKYRDDNVQYEKAVLEDINQKIAILEKQISEDLGDISLEDLEELLKIKRKEQEITTDDLRSRRIERSKFKRAHPRRDRDYRHIKLVEKRKEEERHLKEMEKRRKRAELKRIDAEDDRIRISNFRVAGSDPDLFDKFPF